nr:dihydrolipoyllysine-residue succinyltransferase component of 2-oxoglutarate dehydrogenase complex 1, mitochondrial-like [Ipomoea batatas]GMC51760.1 dihydrolipoyllysine-residue succinyltransferase component of 2-oxoglutarate dehydrogenase complex 1, mitochondrial-like [Ipomoea batatas]
MLGVLRRKVASGATSASALGKSLHTVRPGLFTPRACSVVAEEILIHPIGCGQARNFCHLNLPGKFLPFYVATSLKHSTCTLPSTLIPKCLTGTGNSMNLRAQRGAISNLHPGVTLQIWNRAFCSSGGMISYLVQKSFLLSPLVS